MTDTNERNASAFDWRKTCSIIFLISILLVIFLNLVAKENKYTELQKIRDVVVFFNRSNICQDNNCCVLNPSLEDTRCGGLCCSVKCKRFDTTTSNLSKVLETVISNDCKTQYIELDADDIIFHDDTMTPMWLYSNNFEIRIMTINSAHLKEILPQSFQGNIFHNLSYLILENLILSHMKKGVFEGLHNLKFLFIYKSILNDIDEDISYDINVNLEVLQIFESKLDLQKIAGKAPFGNLYLADLRFNTFEIINPYTFVGLINCQILHLSMSNIARIEKGAFNNMNMLRLLSLNNNSLEHLSVDVFDVDVLYQINLELHTNKWICDCELEWLQQYVLHKFKSDSSYRVPLCAQPIEIPFNEVEFCPITTSTEDSSNLLTTDGLESTDSSLSTLDYQTSTEITKTSTQLIVTSTESLYSSTTQIANEDVPFTTDTSLKTSTHSTATIVSNCDEVIKVQRVFYSVSSLDIYQTNISILNRLANFNASLYNLNTVKICYEDMESNAFLWYNVNNQSLVAYCKYDLTNPFYIGSLLPGQYYVFCLFNSVNIHQLSPFDCQGFFIPFDSKYSAWLKNDEKYFIVGMFCINLLGLWVVGGTITYIAMRINPSLLKGSKNVEMVKSRVTNKTKEKKTIINSTRRYPSNNNKNCVEEFNRRRIMVRSLSETSITSYRSKISYVSAVEPTPKQLYSWRQEIFQKGENVVEISVEPPELPPRSYHLTRAKN